MALSKEEKEALTAHYKGKDLYDPSKAPEQEVPTFQPKAMNCGGMAENYADGGSVGDMDLSGLGDLGDLGAADFAGPVLSADTDTVKGSTTAPRAVAPPLQLSAGDFNPPALPSGPSALPAAPPRAAMPPAPVLPLPGSTATPAASEGAPAGAGKLTPDQFDTLIKSLQPSIGKRIGQGAFSGLAGLADAIETGVARAGNPGFQKNIEETQQNQKTHVSSDFMHRGGIQGPGTGPEPATHRRRDPGSWRRRKERCGASGRGSAPAQPRGRPARRTARRRIWKGQGGSGPESDRSLRKGLGGGICSRSLCPTVEGGVQQRQGSSEE